MMISVVLCKINEEINCVNFPQPRGPDLIAQSNGKTIVKSSQKFEATDVMLGIYSLMIWTICHKLISFYRNAVSLHITFVVTHGEIFSHLGHTGPLTVNKIWRCRRGIGEYGVIFMLLLEEIRLHLGYKGSQRVLILFASHTPQTDELSLVLWSTASQNLRPLGSRSSSDHVGQLRNLACQHVGRFCVRVCSLFVCNWRAKFKLNIIVLCISRHDMVAIMMSNPGLLNTFDVDPLSNSDSQKVQ